MATFPRSSSTNSTQPAVPRNHFYPNRPLAFFYAPIYFYIIVIILCMLATAIFMFARVGAFDHTRQLWTRTLFLYLFISFWLSLGSFLISVIFSEVVMKEELGWWTAVSSVFAELIALLMITALVDMVVGYYRSCRVWLNAWLWRRYRIVWV
jgi:hypothetical protein